MALLPAFTLSAVVNMLNLLAGHDFSDAKGLVAHHPDLSDHHWVARVTAQGLLVTNYPLAIHYLNIGFSSAFNELFTSYSLAFD